MKERLANLAKNRYFIPSIMMMVSLSMVAYALTSVSVPNTVTIISGANIRIIYQTTPFIGSTCPTTGYTANPSGVSFTEPAGGSANAYLCIENIGTGSDTPTISITAGDPSNCGSGGTSPCFTVSPATLPTIPSNGFSAPTNVTISNTYASSPGSPITITVTVS